MALRGIKVIEMMGLAPGPLCGTILADFGANVTVIQKVRDLYHVVDIILRNGLKSMLVHTVTPPYCVN